MIFVISALVAGLAVGVWSSLEEFNNIQGKEIFESKIDVAERNKRFLKWKDVVQRSFNLA